MDQIGGIWSWAGYGRLLLKTLMGSGRVVVFDEGGRDTTMVVLVEDQKRVPIPLGARRSLLCWLLCSSAEEMRLFDVKFAEPGGILHRKAARQG